MIKRQLGKKKNPLKKLLFNVGDKVQVIAGSDKGKVGSVLKIFKSTHRVVVEGVRTQTHFNAEKGIQKIDGPVDYSNVKKVKK